MSESGSNRISLIIFSILLFFIGLLAVYDPVVVLRPGWQVNLSEYHVFIGLVISCVGVLFLYSSLRIEKKVKFVIGGWCGSQNGIRNAALEQ